MNKLIVFLAFISLFASCVKDEPERLPNQFKINGVIHKIAGVYNYCGYSNLIYKTLYSSTLIISDTDLSKITSDVFRDLAIGKYNLDGASVIIITEDVPRGNLETIGEIEEFTYGMASSFKRSSVSINMNFQNGKYNSITGLTSFENSSVYHFDCFEIKFTGTTTDGKTVDCYFFGGKYESVYKL